MLAEIDLYEDVEAWAELHKKELIMDWQRLQAGRKPEPIKPLK